jgi:hypothetical protein
MAVKPEELNEILVEESKKYEEEIDMIIRSKKALYDRDKFTCIVPLQGSLRGLNNTHLKFIRDNYISVGWSKVEMKHRQGEGSWIEFTYEKK